MSIRIISRAAAVVSALSCLLSQAAAQVPESRLAKQFSMGYLQLNVMDHQKLIEKHAKLLGIPEVKVTWQVFNGPAAMNDALDDDARAYHDIC
jgi:NitT/TauT family transport system substrate-binding protein